MEKHGFELAVFRYWFLTSHYSTPSNFTWKSLESTRNAFKKLQNFIRENKTEKPGKVIKKYYKKALKELNHDLGTPEAIAVIWELIKDDKYYNLDKIATVLEIDRFLGLDLGNIKKNKIPNEIIELAKCREEARKNKDFKLADELRDKISEMGYLIKDESTGFTIDIK